MSIDPSLRPYVKKIADLREQLKDTDTLLDKREAQIADLRAQLADTNASLKRLGESQEAWCVHPEGSDPYPDGYVFWTQEDAEENTDPGDVITRLCVYAVGEG